MTRPRRSLLFMPGSNARALEKGRNLPADGLILDLEDSVAPDAKAKARDQIAAAVKAKGFGRREILIRTNSLDTPWWADDVAMAGQAKPDGILVPKISSMDDLTKIGARLSEVGAEPSIKVWAMIETARAVLHAEQLAAAARDLEDPACGVRVRAQRYFAGDADQDAARPRRDDPDDHSLHPGDARAWAGDFGRSLQRYRQYRRLRRRMRARTRSRLRRQDADPSEPYRRLQRDLHAAGGGSRGGTQEFLAAFELPENASRGAIQLDGRMVERLHAEMAKRTIEIADAIAAMAQP